MSHPASAALGRSAQRWPGTSDGLAAAAGAGLVVGAVAAAEAEMAAAGCSSAEEVVLVHP
jgi:hypothetical protein